MKKLNFLPIFITGVGKTSSGNITELHNIISGACALINFEPTPVLMCGVRDDGQIAEVQIEENGRLS